MIVEWLLIIIIIAGHKTLYTRARIVYTIYLYTQTQTHYTFVPRIRSRLIGGIVKRLSFHLFAYTTCEQAFVAIVVTPTCHIQTVVSSICGIFPFRFIFCFLTRKLFSLRHIYFPALY